MSRPLFLLLALAGCAGDLRQEFPFDGALPDGVYVTHEDQPDGSTVTRVDATRKEAWVYLDLDSKLQIPVAEALGAAGWELGFQRFKIISNGGVSGAGAVEVAILPGQEFAALQRAPAGGYRKDAPDSNEDGDQDVDSAFLVEGAWYAYDLVKHRLQPREVVYVVRTSAGAYVKLQMLGYYDAQGTAGGVSFQWAKVEPPG